MQPLHKDLGQTLEKLRNKMAFFQKAATHPGLTKEQIEWINKKSLMFNQVLTSLQDSGSQAQEPASAMAQSLITNIRKVKREVLGWIKFKSTDIEVFKSHSKSEKWIPLMNYLAPPPKFSDIQNADLADINFPCMSYTNQELCQLAERIFKEQDLLTEFKLGPEKLEKIIKKVCLDYNVPAYHNFTHGFNVFQMFYAILKKTELATVLDKTEKFAALLAALGHDLNHRGYNNVYEAKLQSKTALVYFDTAILESMHASLLIKILKDPEVGFFDLLPDLNKKTQFRDLVTAIILATDMSKHNKLLSKFTDNVKATLEYRRLKNSDTPVDSLLEEKAFKMDRPHDKRRILKNIIHACDIGNPCQKFENYMYWSTLVSQEFDTQAKSEQKKSFEVTTIFLYKNLPGFYGGQIFFSKILVLPLWEQINILFKGIEETVENLKMNLRRLEEEKVQATEE